MNLAVAYSRAIEGMSAPEVIVEVHLANGLPSFTIVGLPDAEVKESKDRVRSAIQTSQLEFPLRKITVNLAPADLPKEGARYDLPIALAILAASKQIPEKPLRNYVIAGELALTGELRSIRGALAMAYHSSQDQRTLILPIASSYEAGLVKSVKVLQANSLLDVCAHLHGQKSLHTYQEQVCVQNINYPDMAEVKGQIVAKRALEIAAAGNHSVLMVGPPGTGKSMLAERLPGILPSMNEQECLESAAIQSLSKPFDPQNWGRRPYRSPHHTASSVALVGGGSVPRPGEISLSHHGVLFLDELPEFNRKVLEVLREPLEKGHITISRAARQADFPARFQLIAAMNPCPCGYYGHHSGRCHCTPDQIRRYVGKISGPLMDRIDLHITVPALKQEELLGQAIAEKSECIRTRVEKARQIQLSRQGIPNSQLTTKNLEKYAVPDQGGQGLLKEAITKLNLSARVYHRILKIARTIADLAETDKVAMKHIAEAIQYRRGVSS